MAKLVGRCTGRELQGVGRRRRRPLPIVAVLVLSLLAALLPAEVAVAAPPAKVVDQRPVIAPLPNRTDAEGTVVALQVGYQDPDGHALRIEATGLPKGLSISPTGLIHGTIAYDAAGRHKVTITVTELEARRLSTSVSFVWTVTDTNRPPLLTPIGQQSVEAGTTTSVTIRASDPDGTRIRFSASGTPTFATFVAAGNGTATLSLAPARGQEGTYPMTVTASDGSAAVSETFAVIVTAGANQAPTISPVADVTLAEGATASVTIHVVDPDGDPLAASVEATPSAAAFASLSPVSATSWNLALAPGYEHAGTYLIAVTVSDGVLSSTAGFTLTVTDTNRAPVVEAISDQQVQIGDPIDLAVEASDPDGDVLSFAAVGLPAGTSIDATTGRMTGQAEVPGSYPVEIVVSDGPNTTKVGFTIVVTEAPPPPSGDVRIDLELLLIGASGDEPSLLAWQHVLRSRGVPFDVQLAGDTLTSDDLVVGPDHARYQGVVVATSAVWEALDASERLAIEDLQRDFGVRKVTSYVYPSTTYGLTPPTRGGTDIAEGALTAPGRDTFGYLAGPVPFEWWAWGYEGARPVDAATFTTLVAAADGSALAGVHRTADGREDLVTTVDHNPWTIHTPLLVPGMLDWVTRGVSTSFGREYLALHVDDILLGDDRWDTVANTTVEDGPNPIRMVPSDVSRALDWQSSRGVVLDWVYNGLGATDYGPNDPLTAKLLAERDRFRWINHTYTHLNLDAVSQSAIVDEIQTNIDWAAANDVDIDPAELVTGEHSGLTNPAMAGALTTTGIRWIASDNSRTPQQATLGPALTVPRHPANIYYNVGTREEQLDEYNFIYYDGCVPIPGVHTCLTSPATWAQYVDAEATIMLSHMLGNDPRPHYVHQSNLAEDGVLYDVVDEVLARYDRLFTTDLVQPTLTEAGLLMRDHTAWNAALASGRAGAYLQGGVVHVEVSGPTRVPLTGTQIGDVHGGHRSGWLDATGVHQVAVGQDPGYVLTSSPSSSVASRVTDAPSPVESDQPLPLAPAPTSDELHDLVSDR